jgi:GT2 family glycosyltransferase
MRTSVVILTRDRPEDLDECLRSLAQQTVLPNEVVILDNSSNSATSELISQSRATLPFTLLYDRGHPSLGTATGRNRAIDQASGDIIFILDDDVVLIDHSYIDTILGIFEKDGADELGGVCVNSKLHPDGRLSSCTRLALRIPFLLDSVRPGKVLPSGFRSHFPSKTSRVQCMPGCACAVRRSVVEKVRFDPGFETRPYAMSEDQDFSYRASLDWKLLWTDATRVWHKKSPHGARLNRHDYYLSVVLNHHYFMRKNLGRPINHLAFWWAMVGVFLHCVATLVAGPSRMNLDGLVGFCRGIRLAAKNSVADEEWSV